jgi:hypothetical protein
VASQATRDCLLTPPSHPPPPVRYDRPGLGSTVLRETKHFEGTVAQLRAAGAPTAPTAYADGDAAAAVFSAVAPACLTRYSLDELTLPG